MAELTGIETIKASQLTEATSISDSNYVVVTSGSVSKKAKATLFKGANGKSIEIQKTTTHIQWRQEGGTWTNLVALSDITGPAGSGSDIDLTDYALKSWVTEQIGNIQGGGSIDLSSYQTKIDNELTTAAKTIVGAINENKSSLDNITTQLDGVNFNNIPITITQTEYDSLTEEEKLDKIFLITDSEEQVIEGHTHDNKAILDAITQLKVDEWNKNSGDIASILLRLSALENGEEPPVGEEQLGEIALSKTFTTITEGGSDTFTVSLDKAPTNNQIVTLSVNNSAVTLDKTSLTFTPSNYNTAQTVNISVAEDDNYLNETCTITLTSLNVTSKTLTINIIDNDASESTNYLLTTEDFNIDNKPLVDDCLVINTLDWSHKYLQLNNSEKLNLIEDASTYELEIDIIENTFNCNITNATTLGEIFANKTEYEPTITPNFIGKSYCRYTTVDLNISESYATQFIRFKFSEDVVGSLKFKLNFYKIDNI